MPLFGVIISYSFLELFIISLISSIIPIPTEPVVFGLLEVGRNPELIFIILTTGSIFGASLGYLVGKYGIRKIIPFHDREKEQQMQIYFYKYGAIVLIISPWIPFMGDLAPMVAGVEKYEFKRFLILISIAKIIKSIGIIYLSIRIIDWWTLFTR
jgi:membrane protein YqaA with SNARE-associated domain